MAASLTRKIVSCDHKASKVVFSFEHLTKLRRLAFFWVNVLRVWIGNSYFLISVKISKFSILQLVHTSACVHRDMKHAGSLESTKDA